MPEDGKRHSRIKTKFLLDRLTRKFGHDLVASLVPKADVTTHKRFVACLFSCFLLRALSLSVSLSLSLCICLSLSFSLSPSLLLDRLIKSNPAKKNPRPPDRLFEFDHVLGCATSAKKSPAKTGRPKTVPAVETPAATTMKCLPWPRAGKKRWMSC